MLVKKGVPTAEDCCFTGSCHLPPFGTIRLQSSKRRARITPQDLSNQGSAILLTSLKEIKSLSSENGVKSDSVTVRRSYLNFSRLSLAGETPNGNESDKNKKPDDIGQIFVLVNAWRDLSQILAQWWVLELLA